MTNKEIANTIARLGKVMELHDESPFKTRSYANAYLSIRNVSMPISEMDTEQISEIRGIGKAITAKIQELLATGELQTLIKYEDMTPPGILDMLSIKGFGPKKIKQIWKELDIETPGELLYACHENRLVNLKGFGTKTQDQLIQQINYFLDSKGKYLYAKVFEAVEELLFILREELPEYQFDITGELARKLPVINSIEFITDFDDNISEELLQMGLEHLSFDDDGALIYKSFPIEFYQTSPEEYIEEFIHSASSAEFREALNPYTNAKASTEEEFFTANNLQFIPAELREDKSIVEEAINHKLPDLIEEKDIKGVIHSHTNYSDGQHTIQQMAEFAKKLNYEYILITDHSKSAFYANGLTVERVHQQLDEIDSINNQIDGITIYKGIESDILSSGALDYEEDILRQFDVIIASVHSNLKMDEAKANTRLIKAIENPYTKILGHPTGRLLLTRKGYPIDHKKIIDACAANGVAIELNANPNRLDMDYSYIPYAIEKGVLVSINPDAHTMDGIYDIKWGVAAARKGRLTAEYCLNAMSDTDFANWLS